MAENDMILDGLIDEALEDFLRQENVAQVQSSWDEEEVGQPSDPASEGLPTYTDEEMKALQCTFCIQDETDPSNSGIKEEGRDLAKAGEKRKRKSKGEHHVKTGMQRAG